MASNDNRDHPMTQEELIRFRNIALGLATGATVFSVSFFLLVHYDAIRLYPSSASPETLATFGERAEFAFRYQSLLALWLLINIIATIVGRYIHKAVNPLEPKTEEHVQIYKNTLTNSYETLILSILSQLVFISFASPTAILKFIPLINILNFIGRVAFFAGYPSYRGFGFICTIAPSIILVFYNIFKFGSFIGLY